MLVARLIALILATIAAPAWAHPHAWIDLRTTFLMKDGRIAAIEEEWLFDEFHTSYALSAVKGRIDRASLLDLAGRNLTNLKPYGYFTEISAAGRAVKADTVTSFDSAVRDKRLWLRFVLPLVAPINPRAGPVTVAIFDPSYYIEMLHQEGEPVYFRGHGAEACFGDIRAPKPSMRDIGRAAALDRTATPDTSLGRLFAQRIAIRCK